MITYLLLRDNKQTGPYTFDELKEKGLKAYDLVWVEGKSAAWRYPSEIEELSAFAPVVEEQPFDRFYKKPSQNNGSSNDNTITLPSQDKVAASVISGDSSAVPGKRIIYVTLPAGKTAAAAAVREPREYTPTPHEKYLPAQERTPLPAPSIDSFEENTAQDNGNWRSAVEIAPRTHRQHRSRIAQKVMVGVTVVALLAAGVFIGLSINKDSPGFARILSFGNDNNKDTRKGPAKKTLTEVPAQTLAVNNQPPVQAPPPKDSILLNTPAVKVVNNTPVTTAKANIPAKEKTASAPQKSQMPAGAPKDSLLAVPAVHRESSHRGTMSEEKVDKDVLKNNLSSLVSLGSSGYTVGTFGGVSGLQLTVSNRSVYALDLVVVEVQYIQANKKVFKTENLYFRSIAPGSALMQEAPKSSRGIKVAYKITLVNSKELGLSYSAL